MSHVDSVRARLRTSLAALRSIGSIVTMEDTPTTPAERLRSDIANLETRKAAELAKYDGVLGAVEARGVAADADETMSDEQRSTARKITLEEGATMDAAAEAVKTLDAEILPLRSRLEQIERMAAAQAAAPKPAAPTLIGRKSEADVYDFELRSLAYESADAVLERATRAVDAARMKQDAKDAVHGLLDSDTNRSGALARHILVTGRPEYRSAFSKLVTQQHVVLTDAEARAMNEVRSLQITADPQGGFLMPFTLDPTIILTNAGTRNSIRSRATVKTVATDNWQGVTSAGVTASYGAEGAEVGDGTPAVAQPKVEIHQASAFVPYTVQAEDDLLGLASDVAEMFRDAKERLESAKFTVGTGVAEPNGVVTGVGAAAGSRVAAAVNNVFAVGDVYAVYGELPARWTDNATFMANRKVISLLRQFGTTVGHAFLTDLTGGLPPVLLGMNLFENSEMDGTIGTGDDDILLYGDMRQYRIHDRIGLSVELIPHLMGPNRRPTGERGWYARWRNGANVMVPDAFRLLRV